MKGVATEQVKAVIWNYRQTDDRACIVSAFDEASVGGVAAILEKMVRAGERGERIAALHFIEDAIRFGVGPEEFRQCYRQSSLLAAVREQVYTPDHLIRHLAIHLLGRVGPRSNARVLLDSLPWYIIHDPLNLDGLLVVLLRLDWNMQRVASRKRLLEQLVNAPLFVTRWAAVEVLWWREVEGTWIGRRRREDAWVRQFLRRLAQDEHPRVRAEARWRLEKLRKRAISPRARRAERWERRPKPDISSFFEVELNVHNYLWTSGRADYDAALVEAIAQHIVANPITPGYDIDAYWSAFEATARE